MLSKVGKSLNSNQLSALVDNPQMLGLRLFFFLFLFSFFITSCSEREVNERPSEAPFILQGRIVTVDTVITHDVSYGTMMTINFGVDLQGVDKITRLSYRSEWNDTLIYRDYNGLIGSQVYLGAKIFNVPFYRYHSSNYMTSTFWIPNANLPEKRGYENKDKFLSSFCLNGEVVSWGVKLGWTANPDTVLRFLTACNDTCSSSWSDDFPMSLSESLGEPVHWEMNFWYVSSLDMYLPYTKLVFKNY